MLAAGVQLFSVFSEAIVNDLTLVRIRGELNMAISSATSALDGFTRLGFGICNVT